MNTGTWLSRFVEVLQPISVRADRLAATEPFSGLPRPDLELAAAELRETVVERGTRLTVQGKLANRFWLILEGQALVSADARPLRVAAPGDMVGLAGMLYPAGSPETTIALSPIRAFEADQEQFNRLIAYKPIRARLVAAAGFATRTGSARRRSSTAS
jgi:CRP-like cAMP-binding protein